jgi:hypothetical protein
MIQRVEARLRGELQQEHAAVEAAAADETPSEQPSAAAAEPSAADAATSLVAPPLDGGAYQPEQTAVPHPVGAPVEPEHDREAEPAPRRRSPRAGPGLFLSDHQRRAIEFLTLLRTVVADPPPDEPPAPQAQSP